MSQRLNPMRRIILSRGTPFVGHRIPHTDHPGSQTTSDSRNLRNSGIETYPGYLAAEDGATSSSIFKEAMTTKMVRRLERCVSDDDDDGDDDTMANRMARTREWVHHKSAPIAPGREVLAPCKDTFDTCNDTSSSLVTPSSISTSRDESDFSPCSVEKSMAELEAEFELEAINFLEAFENYKKRCAERWEAECEVEIVEEVEYQDFTNETFLAFASRAHASRQNLGNEPLGKGSMVASEGTEEQNAKLQSDTMEVNHTHQKSLVPTAEKVDTGKSSHERGRLSPQQTHPLQPQPTKVSDNPVQPPSANTRSSKTKNLPQPGISSEKPGGLGVNKIFPCKTCLRPFANKTGANAHARTHLNSDELAKTSVFHAKCPYCQRIFFHRQHFTYHMKVHEGQKNHGCPLCKKKFPTKPHLTSHLIVHFPREERAEVKQVQGPSHLPPRLPKGKLGWRCLVCRETFSFKQALIRHRFTHLDQEKKPALVEQGSGRVCKKFPDNDAYHAHVVTHKKEKLSFRCDQCGKKFARSGALKTHKRVHTSNSKRRYKCDQCRQTFTRTDHLARHQNAVHRNLKKVDCSECGKLFGTKTLMKQHLNNVHLKIRHPCPHCEKTYTSKFNVWSHVKTMHPSTSESRPSSAK